MITYSPEGDTVMAVSFAQDHAQEMWGVLTEMAGVDVSVYAGESGYIQRMRGLASVVVAGPLSSTHRSPEQIERDGRLLHGLRGEVDERLSVDRAKLAAVGYNFCNFGLVIPNPLYEPPVRTNGGWSNTGNRNAYHEYLFLRGEHDGQHSDVAGWKHPDVSKLRLMFMYRECI